MFYVIVVRFSNNIYRFSICKRIYYFWLHQIFLLFFDKNITKHRKYILKVSVNLHQRPSQLRKALFKWQSPCYYCQTACS